MEYRPLGRPGLKAGARNEAQVARLDAASRRLPPYPYWHQRGFEEYIPSVV